jgi:hypothetical protein
MLFSFAILVSFSKLVAMERRLFSLKLLADLAKKEDLFLLILE